jgi:hypothetical protein
MLRRHRRLVAAGITAVVLLAAAAQRRGEPARYTFRITLGLQDRRSTDWGGRVTVQGGEVVSLSGWRFTREDAVHGKDSWDCRTRLYPFPGTTFPLEPPQGKPPAPVPAALWPLGIDLVVQGERPEIAVRLPQGEVKFRAADVRLGEPQTFLDDEVRVEWLPDTIVVRPPAPATARDAVEDDYPAFWVHYRSRKHYLAWVAYHRAADRVLLAERDGPAARW